MKDSELFELDLDLYADLTNSEKEELEQLEKDPLVAKGKEIVSEIYKKKQRLYKLRYFRKKALESIKKDSNENNTNKSEI